MDISSLLNNNFWKFFFVSMFLKMEMTYPVSQGFWDGRNDFVDWVMCKALSVSNKRRGKGKGISLGWSK